MVYNQVVLSHCAMVKAQKDSIQPQKDRIGRAVSVYKRTS